MQDCSDDNTVCESKITYGSDDGTITTKEDDEDGDVGTFSASEYPGYCGHFGGGKTPPPKVTAMRHAGPLKCSERKAPCHRPVNQGEGSEEKEASG